MSYLNLFISLQGGYSLMVVQSTLEVTTMTFVLPILYLVLNYLLMIIHVLGVFHTMKKTLTKSLTESIANLRSGRRSFITHPR